MNKNNLLIRVLSAALVAVLLSAGLAACAGDQTPAETTAETTSDESTERVWLDDLPDKKFDGKEFLVYGDCSEWQDPGQPDVARKDVVSAANYDRYHNVEERFNMKFKYVEPTVAPEDIRKPVLGLQQYVDSDTYAFDVIHGIACYLAPSALQGYVIDMAAYDEFQANIDLSKPYWSKEYTEALSIYNYRFWIYGACDGGMYSGAFCIFFNKDIAAVYLDEDQTMYDFVYDGTWTLDKLYDLERKAYIDDGNSEKDNNDQYGLYVQYLDKLATAAGATYTLRDEDNVPYSNINTEQNVNINEILYDMVNSDGYYKYPSDGSAPLNFGSGKFMMYMSMIGSVSGFRDIKWDFGLLPMPKYNEAQEEYYGSARYSALIDGVPITTPEENYDFIFTILEANSAEVWRTTRPAFLDEALKNKYSRDEDTKNMVDLTQKHILTDFLIIYADQEYENFFSNNIGSGSRDISSMIARKTKSLNKTIEKYLEEFAEHSQQEG